MQMNLPHNTLVNSQRIYRSRHGLRRVDIVPSTLPIICAHRFNCTRAQASSNSFGNDAAKSNDDAKLEEQSIPQATTSSPSFQQPNTTTNAKDAEGQPTGLWGKLKQMFGSKIDKQKLAAYGFGAFCAYGVISNVNAGVLITIAWLTVVKTTGLTPLAAGIWPKFLAVYAGLWVSSHFMRPIRLSLAIAAAPFFDSNLTAIMKRTGLNKIGAFVVMLVCIAVGTFSTLAATIWVCGGFPQTAAA